MSATPTPTDSAIAPFGRADVAPSTKLVAAPQTSASAHPVPNGLGGLTPDEVKHPSNGVPSDAFADPDEDLAWARPRPIASTRLRVTVGVLALAFVGTLGFAAGTRYGRAHAPVTSPFGRGGFGRGGLAGGFGQGTGGGGFGRRATSDQGAGATGGSIASSVPNSGGGGLGALLPK